MLSLHRGDRVPEGKTPHWGVVSFAFSIGGRIPLMAGLIIVGRFWIERGGRAQHGQKTTQAKNGGGLVGDNSCWPLTVVAGPGLGIAAF